MVTSGVMPRLVAWTDVNTNGLKETGEPYSAITYTRLSHTNCVNATLPAKLTDADQDGLPDWWELTHGLSPDDPLDAYQDPDGDGLINLHEYWNESDIAVSPVFLLLGDDLILLGAAHTGNHAVSDGVYKGANYPSVVNYKQRVQQLMDELCPGYGLRQYDFSGFEKLPRYANREVS